MSIITQADDISRTSELQKTNSQAVNRLIA